MLRGLQVAVPIRNQTRRCVIRQSRTNNCQWHLVSAASVSWGGQHCEHLTASARAGHNDGMDFVLRDLRHLTQALERGLNVLVGRRCPVIRTIGGSSMACFVELDVSQKITAICAIDNAPKRAKTRTMPAHNSLRLYDYQDIHNARRNRVEAGKNQTTRKFPHPKGNSLQDAANSLLVSINSLFCNKIPCSDF
jgi:hypothetical protein